MQLFKDEQHQFFLEFEDDDFESKRATHEWLKNECGALFSQSFEEARQYWVNTVTKSVNRRFRYYNRGKKGDKTKFWGHLIFSYLWKTSGKLEDLDSFQWIPLSEISNNLVRYRRTGRPKKSMIGRDFQDIDEPPIPHYTTLIRSLDDLVKSELIERKKEVIDLQSKPSKTKENTFYRISKQVYEDAVSPEEQIIKLKMEVDRYQKEFWNLSKRLVAISKIFDSRGIEWPTKEEIEAWMVAIEQGKVKL